MNAFHRRRPLAIALATVLCGALGFAAITSSAQDRLLKGRAVTESNVLEALTPPARGEEPVVTRSLKVSPDSATPSQVQAPRRKPSASLLITFATNSSTLQERSKEQLNVVASALRNERLKDFSFDVEGHADPRGNPERNKLLSQQRAESVRNYLIAAQHIPEEKLRAVGKGDTELMNLKDIAAPENRRVTIVTNAP